MEDRVTKGQLRLGRSKQSEECIQKIIAQAKLDGVEAIYGDEENSPYALLGKDDCVVRFPNGLTHTQIKKYVKMTEGRTIEEE